MAKYLCMISILMLTIFKLLFIYNQMRIYKSYFLFAIFFISISFSCEHTENLSKTIKASVIQDTLQSLDVDTMAAKNIIEIDSLKLEFARILLLPTDSIEDIKLYKFLSENIGKKCFGIKNPEYDCESFLKFLVKNVYEIDISIIIEEQMKSKSFTLYTDSTFLRKGDLLFFNYSAKQTEKISHAGLYLQNGFFVLASYNKGVTITKFKNGFWEKRFVAAGRMVYNK